MWWNFCRFSQIPMCMRVNWNRHWLTTFSIFFWNWDKGDSIVKYTLPEDNHQIFASKYFRYLPTEELKHELNLDDFYKLEEWYGCWQQNLSELWQENETACTLFGIFICSLLMLSLLILWEGQRKCICILDELCYNVNSPLVHWGEEN